VRQARTYPESRAPRKGHRIDASTRPGTVKRPGRPRDPSLEPRIFAAALTVYAESGWSGFSFEAVARRAGVGKAPLYLRWSSREALLLDAFAARSAAIIIRDTGDLRADLVAYTCQLLEEKQDAQGWAFLRIHLEAALTPELHDLFTSAVANPHISGARRLLEAAAERGELSRDASVTLMLEGIYGAVIMRTLLAPPDRRSRLARERRAHAAAIVDLVLDGARGSARRR
jgi:AcrR family transcriptional regulator